MLNLLVVFLCSILLVELPKQWVQRRKKTYISVLSMTDPEQQSNGMEAKYTMEVWFLPTGMIFSDILMMWKTRPGLVAHGGQRLHFFFASISTLSYSELNGGALNSEFREFCSHCFRALQTKNYVTI